MGFPSLMVCSRGQSVRRLSVWCGVATLLSASAWGCQPRPSPDPTSPAPITVQGSERVGWDQQAPDATELSGYRYVAYVDGVGQPLPDASCQDGAGPTQFDCSARLPPMSSGAHRLELAVVREIDGAASDKSLPLDLLVVPTQGRGTTQSGRSRLVVTAADGTDFVVETLATGLNTPSGLAVTPDGRVLIAERSGDVRVWQNGEVLPEPAVRLSDAAQGEDVGLLGIALHPDFSQNGQVFVLYTARSGDGTFANRVVRYREVNNVFGQAALILEDAAAEPPQRTPRIRFGRDRKLYLALPAGTDRSISEDPASYVGKILRINDDGTTPRDNPGYSPVISDGHRAPVGFDWHPRSAQLWVGEHDWDDRDQLSLVGSPVNDGSSPLQRSRDRTAFYFDSVIDPSGASFYAATAIDGFRNDLFIAALSGQHIRRVRFDPLQPNRIIATERLLDHQLGRISDILTGPDGALYFSTSNRLGRGAPGAQDDRLERLIVPSTPNRPNR